MAGKARNEPLGPGECDSATAARLLMCSLQWFGKLVKDGWIKKEGPNRFKVIEVVQGHIRYMKDEQRRATKTQSASRVQDARADQIELQTKKELRELIPADEVIEFLSETVGTLRSELAGVAAASSRDPIVRAEIEKNLDAAIEKCRTAFAAADGAVRARRPIVVEAEEADA